MAKKRATLRRKENNKELYLATDEHRWPQMKQQNFVGRKKAQKAHKDSRRIFCAFCASLRQ
jgi:hypothetical protein